MRLRGDGNVLFSLNNKKCIVFEQHNIGNVLFSNRKTLTVSTLQETNMTQDGAKQDTKSSREDEILWVAHL